MPVVLTVDKRIYDGAIQVSINMRDESGAGHGFRTAGPKYDGSGKTLLSKTLTKRDADEITVLWRKRHKPNGCGGPTWPTSGG